MDVFDIKHGSSESGYLTGQLLIAMPNMRDPRFEKSVIYMCVHNAEGAVGLVVNRQIDSITFPDLLKQLNIEPAESAPNLPIHFGGPVETGRGFVLHSAEYGVCEACGADITYIRLAGNPTLRRCAGCETRR